MRSSWSRIGLRLLPAAAAIAAGAAALAAQQPPKERGIAAVYTTLCANCHGPAMAGGVAPSLLDDVWTRGGTDADLVRSIRDGWPASGMPAFKGALAEPDIRAMVIYIRETRARARAGLIPFNAVGAPMPPRLSSERHAFKIETVADGLDTPWGLDFLPDGRLLVTERPGRLRIVGKDGALTEVRGLPPVWVRQDGGLMDVALHPQYEANGWIYLAFSEPGAAAEASTTRIIRARIRDAQLVDQQDLFKAPAELFWVDNTHYGARFAFDRQGYLYYSIGDRGRLDTPQDLASPYGKLHRVHDDGRAPADNPFADRPGAVKTIWSYGHRNQQGLAFHPETGALWAAEHGPRGGDELNLIAKGRNYGWPVITHGMNYDGSAITELTEKAGMEQPVVEWTPSIAVCALAFYTGDRFPQWRHHLFATALAGQELRRLEISNGRVTNQETLFRGFGRVRDVATGPDGYLYVAINNPGRIVRLVPEG